MALPLAVGNLIRVVVNCQAPFQLAQNNFLYRINATTGSPTDENMAAAVSAMFSTLYKDLMPAEARYSGCILRLEYDSLLGGGAPGHFSDEGSGPGNAEGVLQATNVAAIITKLSNIRGPRGRGRVYIPFVSSLYGNAQGLPDMDTVGPKLVDLATLTIGYDATYETWDDDAGNTCTVYSIISAPFPDTPTTDVITAGFQVRKKWGNIRKRSDQGKPNYPIA